MERFRAPRRPAPHSMVGAIATFGVIVYVGTTFLIIVEGGMLLTGAERPAIGLMALATALVAVTIDSTHQAIRRGVNRLAHGHRLSAEEAVRQLSWSLSLQRDPDTILATMADVIAAGVGAARVAVLLCVGNQLECRASTGEGSPLQPILFETGGEVQMPGFDVVVPIGRPGDTAGAIAVAKGKRGAPTSSERKLLDDIASQAGMAMRTVQLQENLRRRVALARRTEAQLADTTRRIVATHDEERRRLERDIHDRCQQRAIALAGKLGLIAELATDDLSQTTTLLAEIDADLTKLQEALARAVAGGALPELIEGGIGPALSADTSDLPIHVRVEDTTVRRYDWSIETCVFFCCAEAIQNTVKHSGATHVAIRLWEEDGRVCFSVTDDGRGFERSGDEHGMGLGNIDGRIRAVGGTWGFDSVSHGTTLSGCVPLPTGLG